MQTQLSKFTNETRLHIEYNQDATGKCNIDIKGYSDLKHHLIEDLIVFLAESFDMESHLHHAISKLELKLQDYKDRRYADEKKEHKKAKDN